MIKKIILVAIWFLCWMGLWNLVGKLISAQDTFLVVLGVFVTLIFVIVSIKTVCFTKKWKLNNKNKEEKQ